MAADKNGRGLAGGHVVFWFGLGIFHRLAQLVVLSIRCFLVLQSSCLSMMDKRGLQHEFSGYVA